MELQNRIILLAVTVIAVNCEGSSTNSSCQQSVPGSCSHETFCTAAGQCQQCPAGTLNCDGDNTNLCEETATTCGTTPTPSFSTDVATPEEFCAAFATARCAGIASCCKDPNFKPINIDECRGKWETTCELVVVADVPSCVAFSHVKAKAKLEQMKADLPGCTPPAVSTPVGGVFEGTYIAGAACQTAGAQWQECCGPGTYCRSELGPQGVCASLIPVGQPCDPNALGVSCADYCEMNADLTGGQCQPLKPNGASCTSGVECSSDFCSNSGTCGPQEDYFCTAL